MCRVILHKKNSQFADLVANVLYTGIFYIVESAKAITVTWDTVDQILNQEVSPAREVR